MDALTKVVQALWGTLALLESHMGPMGPTLICTTLWHVTTEAHTLTLTLIFYVLLICDEKNNNKEILEVDGEPVFVCVNRVQPEDACEMVLKHTEKSGDNLKIILCF